MIKKYRFYELVRKINKEIGEERELIALVDKMVKTEYFSFIIIKLRNLDPMTTFPKIKNTKAMQDFERVHKVNCVLGKRLGKWVIQINF